MDEMKIQGQVAAQRARNKALLKAIASHGASLEAKRPTDHSFNVKRDSDAAKLVQDLKLLGFEEVEKSKIGSFLFSKFLIKAVIGASPNEVTDEAFVEKVVRLAANHNAEYDGWGMSLG